MRNAVLEIEQDAGSYVRHLFVLVLGLIAHGAASAAFDLVVSSKRASHAMPTLSERARKKIESLRSSLVAMII